MARILNIETSTRVCSVAVSVDGTIVSLKESHTENSHAEQITLFSQEVMKEVGLSVDDLDAVAVSMGPGSYTGLRIGVSTAKGYCYGADIPLIAIGTLEAMAAGMSGKIKSVNDNYILCPMIDARRMEVYAALFNEQVDEIRETKAVVVDENSFSDTLGNNEVWFAGDGAPKCKDVLSGSKNARFLDDFHPSASYLGPIAEYKFQNSQFEDTAYFEPFYLKDFVAGIPKVKGLR